MLKLRENQNRQNFNLKKIILQKKNSIEYYNIYWSNLSIFSLSRSKSFSRTPNIISLFVFPWFKIFLNTSKSNCSVSRYSLKFPIQMSVNFSFEIFSNLSSSFIYKYCHRFSYLIWLLIFSFVFFIIIISWNLCKVSNSYK